MINGDGQKLLSLAFFYIQFPLTYKILMQRREVFSPVPALNQNSSFQEHDVEKDAEVQCGQGRLVFIDAEQLDRVDIIAHFKEQK